MAPKFEDKPECQEAVGALREPGVSQAAILDCLQTLYDQYGADEAWTTIKAQGYKKVRELLDGKNAKKAELMEPSGAKPGPSEMQLAEAQVLCDLMAVPPDYLRHVLAVIYQNFGGQPEVWAVIRGQGEGLWADVIQYIEDDPARPSPPAQEAFGLPSPGLPQPSGGAVAARDTSSSRRPLHPETSNPAQRSSSQFSAKPLRRATRPLSPRGPQHGLHRQDGLQGTGPNVTPLQQALIDDVDREAAGLASPHSLRFPHLSDTLSPPLRGESALPAHLLEPQFAGRPLLGGMSKSVGATSGRGDARDKHPGGAQLLEPTSSLPQHASLVRKSQEATEEAQRKRRREREHQGELRAKAVAIQRGQQGVNGVAHADAPERRDGGGAARDSGGAVGGRQSASAGGSESMEVERNSAGLRSSTRGPEGPRGGALEQALKTLHEVPGSSQAGGSERLGHTGGPNGEASGGKRGGATLEGAASGGKNEADGSAAVQGEDFALEDRKSDSLEGGVGRGGESGRVVANGAHGSDRGPPEQLVGGGAGAGEATALWTGGDHTLAPVHEAGGAGGEFGMEEEGERRKLKRIRKVGEITPAVHTTVEGGREDQPAEKRCDEAERSGRAGNEGCGGEENGAGRIRVQEQAKGSKEIWGPTGDSKARPSKLKSLAKIVQEPEKKRRDEKRGQHKAGRAEGTRAVPLTDAGGLPSNTRGIERKTSGHVAGESGLKGVGAKAEREGTGAGGERVVSEDLSRGLERHKIRCVNAVTEDSLPEGFRYMRESKVFERAQAHAPSCLALLPDNAQCDCEGNCLDAALPCGCTVDTRGCYAYDKNGCLDSAFLQKQIDFCLGVCLTQKAKMPAAERLTQAVPPCEGHLLFIKECSVKCLCHNACGNRVVQRGIAVKLEVFWAMDKGWGVRCLEDLPPGTFVCEYVGEILTTDELDERNRALKSTKKHFPVELNACPVTEDYIEDDTGLCLDATYLGNVARFINHRCGDATLIDVPVEIEGPKHNYYHIAFFTNCSVEAGTELTWDYGIDFDDEKHPIKAFDCLCGSAFCRRRPTVTQPGL